MNHYVNASANVIKIYLGWILIHYFAVHIYARVCVPSTLTGFLMSPLLAPAPHCVGLRWAIHTGGSSISAMWLLMGFALVKFMTPVIAPKQN